jgi:hypothetical protein
MLPFFLAVLVIFGFTVFASIKICYPFWNLQPVFHTYDYWRYFYREPFFVYPHQPIKTKFCDFSKIETIPYLETSNQQHADITDLLQCYSIGSERILYTFTKEDLHAYFVGHTEPAYISIYQETHYHEKVDPSYQILPLCKPLGTIASRPVLFYYGSYLRPKKHPAYFMDFLCVKRDRDVKKINRSLLSTHEYNQRKKNPNISISIVKKEIDLLEGVVPFVSYQNHLFYLRPVQVPKLPESFHTLQITKSSSLDVVADFLYTNPENMLLKFQSITLPDISSLASLLERELLYIFCLRNRDKIYGMYFLKDLKCQYDDIDGSTLQCIACVMTENQPDLFFLGFLHSLRNLLKKKPIYKMLFLDETSDTSIVLKYWRTKHTPIFSNPTAYYLYNFIYPSSPLSPESCLFLL